MTWPGKRRREKGETRMEYLIAFRGMVVPTKLGRLVGRPTGRTLTVVEKEEEEKRGRSDLLL